MIILDSKKTDKVYNLTSLIPEMMKEEKVSFEFAIGYFMENLKCERYRVFPPGTTMLEVTAWIVGEGKTKYVN